MKPRETFPTSTELRKFPEFYKYKTLTYRGQKMVFDQDIRTGECYFCKKTGRVQRTQKTNLHHLKYDDSDPLAWTLEICTSCHYRVDTKNKKIIDWHYCRKRRDLTAKCIAMSHNRMPPL